MKTKIKKMMFLIKNLYEGGELVLNASTWNYHFKLTDRSYSISDVQDYFQYILKNYGENIDNPSVKIDRITFKIQTGYYLELLTS